MAHNIKDAHCTIDIRRNDSGGALVFYIITLVVLSVLTAAMLTLFQRANKIATDVNHFKLAYYMAESGIRYGQSQMKLRGYSIDQKMGNINGIPLYTVEEEKQFKLKVYALGTMESVNTDHVEANQQLELKQPGNEPFPDGYTIPTFGTSADDLYAVSSQDLDFIQAQNNARVIGSSMNADKTRIFLTLQDSLWPDISGRVYFLAVQVKTGSQTVKEGDNLTVNAGGVIFPENNGIITVKSHDYLYEERLDNGDGTYTFTNLSKPPDSDGNSQSWESGWAPENGDDLKNLGNGDFVVLNSLNNLNLWATATGISGSEQVEKSITQSFFVAEDTRKKKDAITHALDHTVVTSDTGTNPVELTGDPGVNLGAGVYYTFGAVWYSGTDHGVNLFCIDGECDFGLGLRSFFTVEFDIKNADGFVFTIMNGEDNSTTDVGGDSELGELMAYAGDSRVYKNNPEDPSKPIDTWVDPDRNGIQPPKFGVEFDTYRNAYQSCICSSDTSTPAGTRLDPTTDPREHIGFVFWGDDLESGCSHGFNCRKENSSLYSYTEDGLKTYDDNKHNSGLNSDTDEVFQASSDVQKWYTISNTYEYAVRIEMHRSLDAVDDAADANYGKYEYTNKVWVNRCSQLTNCAEFVNVDKTLWDLEGDYEINSVDNPGYPYLYPVLEKTFYLGQADHDKMNTILIGFTEGTGAATQVAKIRNYRTVFRAGGDDDITTIP